MATLKKCLLSQSLKSWILSCAILGSFLCTGIIISIQHSDSLPPNLRRPDELKDIPMTYYGFLFGIFRLTVFISSTLFAKYLSTFGVRKVFLGGLSMAGTMTITFALLNQTQVQLTLREETLVPVLVAVRIIGAAGTTAFLTASFTIVGDLFSNSVGTVFAVEQMFLAIGMLIGQHYSTPTFFTIQLLGFVLIVFTIISSLTLPSFKNPADHLERHFGILSALKKSTIALAALSVFSASLAIGTLHTAADQHLTDIIHLTTPQVKYFFMMYTLACVMVTPCWGLLSDKVDPKYVILLGSFQTFLGFVLLGPTPLTGLSASHSLSLVSVVLAGSGIGAQLVAAFTEAQRSAVANGFPPEISTAFLMSSIWTAAFALGAFTGPVTAGVLFDHVGFAWSTVFVVGWNVLVCVRASKCLPSAPRNQENTNYSSDEERKHLLSEKILCC